MPWPSSQQGCQAQACTSTGACLLRTPLVECASQLGVVPKPECPTSSLRECSCWHTPGSAGQSRQALACAAGSLHGPLRWPGRGLFLRHTARCSGPTPPKQTSPPVWTCSNPGDPANQTADPRLLTPRCPAAADNIDFLTRTRRDGEPPGAAHTAPASCITSHTQQPCPPNRKHKKNGLHSANAGAALKFKGPTSSNILFAPRLIP